MTGANQKKTHQVFFSLHQEHFPHLKMNTIIAVNG